MERDFGLITNYFVEEGIVRPTMFLNYYPDRQHTHSETEPTRTTNATSDTASSIGKSPSIEKPASTASLSRSMVIIPERKPTPPIYTAYQAPPYTPTAPMTAPHDPHQTPIGLTTPPYGQATVEQIVNRGDLTPDQMVNLIRGMSLTSATTQPGHANPMGAAPAPHATQPTGALYPNPLTSSSSSVTLPPFYGNEGEFGEWWQYFIQMVDRNPALLPIEKLKMLKESLRGKTKFLAQKTYLEDGAYDFLKERLWTLYGDSVSTVLTLKQRLTQWETIKPNNFQSLAEFNAFMHQYVRQVGAVDGGQHFSCNETLYLFESKFHSLMKLDYRRCIQNRQMDRGRMTDEQKLRYMMEWTDELVTLQHFEDVSDPNHVPAPLGLSMSIMGSASKDRKKREKEKDKEKEKKDEKKSKDKPYPTIASFATQAQPEETVLQTFQKQNFRKRNDRKKDDKGQNKKGAGDGKGDTKKPQSGASSSAHANEQKNRSEEDKGSTCLFCDLKGPSNTSLYLHQDEARYGSDEGIPSWNLPKLSPQGARPHFLSSPCMWVRWLQGEAQQEVSHQEERRLRTCRSLFGSDLFRSLQAVTLRTTSVILLVLV